MVLVWFFIFRNTTNQQLRRLPSSGMNEKLAAPWYHCLIPLALDERDGALHQVAAYCKIIPIITDTIVSTCHGNGRMSKAKHDPLEVTNVIVHTTCYF